MRSASCASRSSGEHLIETITVPGLSNELRAAKERIFGDQFDHRRALHWGACWRPGTVRHVAIFTGYSAIRVELRGRVDWGGGAGVRGERRWTAVGGLGRGDPVTWVPGGGRASENGRKIEAETIDMVLLQA
jgi:hypothetical protein